MGGKKFGAILRKQNKKCVWRSQTHFCLHIEKSDSPSHFAGTQAAGTDVNMLGCAFNDSLHASHIGLPGTIGTSVRMGHLNAEGNALAANFTLCHFSAPPSRLNP